MSSLTAGMQCMQRQAAQQHAAVELQRQAAIARLGPSPGPVLQVAQAFTPQQVRAGPASRWYTLGPYWYKDISCKHLLTALACTYLLARDD